MFVVFLNMFVRKYEKIIHILIVLFAIAHQLEYAKSLEVCEQAFRSRKCTCWSFTCLAMSP